MNKKIFHKNLYIDQLKQLRLIGFIGLGLLTLIAVLMPIGKAMSVSQASRYNAFVGRTNLSILGSHFFLYFVMVLLVPLLTLVCFHFLTQRNASDFYHSLPHTRTCIFTCCMAAIFTWTTILVWAPTIISIIMYTIFSQYFVLEIGLLLRFALFIYLASFLVAAAIGIACSLTGTVFTNVIVAGIIIFLPRIFILFLVQIISSSSTLLVGSHLFPLLDYSYNIIFSLLLSALENGNLTWSGFIYSFILTVIYLFIGLFVFKRRKSEAAGQAAVSKKVQVVIRLLLGTAVSMFPISIIFSMMTQENRYSEDRAFLFYGIFVLYLVACLVMLLYELLTTKKLKNVVKALPSIGILAVINVVIILGTFGIQKYLVSYSPSADDIDYVILSRSTNDDVKAYYDEMVSNTKIEDKKVLKLVSDTLKGNIDGSIDYGTYTGIGEMTEITVGIHSGISTHYRRLIIPMDDCQTILSTAATSKDYSNVYLELPELGGNKLSMYSTEMSDKDYLELYNTAREEIKTLKFEDWFNELYSGNACLDAIAFYATVNDKSLKGTIPITAKLPKTCAKYLELTDAMHQKDKSDTLTFIKDIVANGDNDQGDYNMDIRIFDLQAGEFYYYSICTGSYAPDKAGLNDDAVTHEAIASIAAGSKEISSLSVENDYVVMIDFYHFIPNSNTDTQASCAFILDKSSISQLQDGSDATEEYNEVIE